MKPQYFLRFEGFAALAGGLAVYFWAGGPFWLLAVLALAPDLSVLGYLAGPRAGGFTYNVAHTYVLPLGLAGVGVWTGSATALHVAAVWVAHIGFDRLLGFGLKYGSGFRDTHLSEQPRPTGLLTVPE